MKTIVYIAQSLDGYIADRNGGLDWLSEIPNPDNDDFGFSKFMNEIDAVVMGRKTFEKVQTFNLWPYTKMVYVVSRSVKKLPQDYSGKAELLNLTPGDIVSTLSDLGLQKLYIDGGSLIQSFLKNDLIDELIITTLPIILGDGIPLFGILGEPLRFSLGKSEILLDSMVKSKYIRAN